MERAIDYFCAPQSPWTYLGHERFVALAAACGATVHVKPVDIVRVYRATGGLMLADRPAARRSYRLLELARFAAALASPLVVEPRFFPVSGDEACRRLVAAAAIAPDRVLDFLLGLHRVVWVEERDLADAATLDAVAAACGLDARAIAELAAEPSSQARVDANSDEAVAAEVFGVPTYVPRFGAVAGERFWGQDRLEPLARAVGLGK